jgi:hypothetical protein
MMELRPARANCYRKKRADTPPRGGDAEYLYVLDSDHSSILIQINSDSEI